MHCSYLHRLYNNKKDTKNDKKIDGRNAISK
jgi:hypothetical protein